MNMAQLKCGADYFFEIVEQDSAACMTGKEHGIKRGDSTLLRNTDKAERDQVERIDYYACPSDIWIALLKPIA